VNNKKLFVISNT